MVDLARQAFSSKNFDLAADIYERSITEHGPKSELLLGLADSLAKAGHFSKAFTVYSKACRVGGLSPGDLKHLVSALVSAVTKQDNLLNAEMNKNVVFDCLICRNMVFDPVTIPCGHTFCRTCLQKEVSKVCRNCGTVNQYLNVGRCRSNVLLTQVIENWFPHHCKAVKLKRKANQAFGNCNYEDAIILYSKALELVPQDHILWSNRSHAYLSLDRNKEALDDAETVLKIRPDWPKGYFRRGGALYGLGHYEESVVALLQCLALDSSIETAKEYLSKALHNIITPLSPDDPKAAELQRELNPSLLDQLIHSNFDTSLLLPTVTVDTVRQLKEIISDTVNTAANFLEGRDPGHAEEKSVQAESEAASTSETTSQSEQTSIRCLSAPSSRAGTPVMLKRKHSEASGLSFMDQSEAKPGSSNVPEPSSPTHSAGKKKVEAKGIALAPFVNPNLLNKEDFECSLCYRLLHLPVTTPCGHVFCRPCLDKVLDHKTECPLCKSCLAEYLAERRQVVTFAVENLLQVYFPEESKLRKTQHEDEMSELASMGIDNQHEIPIFVCTLAYPGVSCPLHIFEPRYRLMIRQCMESGRRQFGMCIALGDEESSFSDYGCILEIRDVQFFADGRSLVDTVGGKRFKVISKGQRDGYHTAKVEYFNDSPAENQEELRAMSEKLYGISRKWYDSLPSVQQSQIRQHLGEFPQQETENYGQNGSAWHWWMVAVLPLDPRIQLAMLAMTSYKERLQGVGRVLGFLKNRRDSR